MLLGESRGEIREEEGEGRGRGEGGEGHFNLWFGYQEPVGSPWVASGRAGGDS